LREAPYLAVEDHII